MICISLRDSSVTLDVLLFPGSSSVPLHFPIPCLTPAIIQTYTSFAWNNLGQPSSRLTPTSIPRKIGNNIITLDYNNSNHLFALQGSSPLTGLCSHWPLYLGMAAIVTNSPILIFFFSPNKVVSNHLHHQVNWERQRSCSLIMWLSTPRLQTNLPPQRDKHASSILTLYSIWYFKPAWNSLYEVMVDF